MQVFAQIRKVDEEKRLVYGRAADETPDKSGEMLNYDASKPHFQKWSNEIAKDTDGKSLGNVRAMHGKTAAGVLKGIDFDDTARTIDVVAKVVDDNEWKKVLEGVYTGFSIGGSYGAKTVEKVDGKEFTRYEAIPSEISLVDRPCIPTAKFFQVQKADGATVDVEFKKTEEIPEGVTAEQWGAKSADEKAAYLKQIEDAKAKKGAEKVDGEVEGTPEQVDELTKLMAEKGLTLGDVIEMAKVAAREDVNAKEGKKKYGDVTFADEKNKKYPLDTEAHVRAAASYFGMPKNRSKYSAEDQKTIDAKIAAAEKKFGIGEAAKDKDAEKAEAAKFSKMLRAELRKGMYQCAQFAQIIAALQDLKSSVEYESYREGDNSPLPDRLDAVIALSGEVLKEMIDEEISESQEEGVDVGEEVMEMSAKLGNLSKFEGDPLLTLIKYGARHSADDKDRVNAIHKAAVELGADCSGPEKAEGATLQKSEDELSKMISAAVEPLQKALDDAHAKIVKLEAQPMPTKVVLKAISKAEDNGEVSKSPTEADLVKDAHGAIHPAASLIKQQFEQGGQPLVYRG